MDDENVGTTVTTGWLRTLSVDTVETPTSETFQKAVDLPREEFTKVFDRQVKASMGFSPRLKKKKE